MSLLAPLRYLTTSIASTSRLPVLSFSRTLTTTQNPSSPRQPHDLSAQLDRRNKTADIAGNAILSAFVGIDVEGIAIGGSKAKKMRESLASVTDSSSVSDFLSPTSSSSLLTSSTSSLLSSSLEQPGYSPTSIPPKEDPILNLLTNLLMKHGNKEGARKIVVESLRELQRTTHKPPLPLLHSAILLSSPSIRLTSLRRSSKILQIPSALTARQRTRTAIMWILKAAEKGRGGGLTRGQRIAREVLGVLEGGGVLARKEEVHKLGAVNRSNLNTR